MTTRTAYFSALVATALVGTLAAPAGATPDRSGRDRGGLDRDVRVATFNASLNRSAEGELTSDLSDGEDEQARNVAETIQRTRPDVVLVNEFDYAPGNEDLFRENYLEVGQRGAEPVDYPYAYIAPSNTGVPSGHDLNNDGTVGGPDDAYGFGLYPGQYGMVVYSRYPIDTDEVRTFRQFRWQDMPGNLIPKRFYDAKERKDLRLSSKSHWDVPVEVGGRTLHVLAAHPTPPTFDGEEDRNGRRNHDEIRFWADYVAGKRASSYIYDDQGRSGGLGRFERFVIVGDYNADPVDGDSRDGAINQLLDSRDVRTRVVPDSEGAVEQAELQGGANLDHVADPAFDTADFTDSPEPGNLRVDYVLPSRTLPILDAGVFWPTEDDPLFRLVGTYPFPTSDHRLVWADLRLLHRD
ncbi:Glycerophosphoryl diester phosphodiesterase [Serinicoccus hydrothermalis]|uniref:Glycerophosphoryl diester phosphodiesterase n=1 Tax=Serinicoccus hydrothermalis TaxID=1758689 RepID=A0A1B1NEW0_9MICO|nr:endonuclease/exonuclease/phosphatase family protein [Serinicoccus hydrothermalis]ANS79970.1 Glycerophosphoryl diester phosphodiesterase [Serinicoccus hydrothermalis]